jgi:hypothetical protein
MCATQYSLTWPAHVGERVVLRVCATSVISVCLFCALVPFDTAVTLRYDAKLGIVVLRTPHRRFALYFADADAFIVSVERMFLRGSAFTSCIQALDGAMSQWIDACCGCSGT